MPGGPGSSGGCATSSSTSATPTAVCSARTSPRCCGGCTGSRCITSRRRAAQPAQDRPAPPASPHGRPVFLLASATISDPADCARLLTGRPAEAVTETRAPRAGHLRAVGTAADPAHGEAARRSGAAPPRRPRSLLADLVADQVPALAFTRSRRGAEAVALAARRALRGGRGGRARAGRRLPLRLPARGPPGAGGSAAHRRRSPGWPPPPRWSSGWTSPAWTRC